MGNIAAHWKSFKKNYEIYMIASGNEAKTDYDKIALLLNIMGHEGVELYKTLDLTSEDRQKYAKVIQTFEDHTIPKKNEAYERYVFDQQNQANLKLSLLWKETSSKTVPAYGKKCSKCHKLNHFAVVCGTQKHMHIRGTNEDEKESGGIDDVAFMYGITVNQETTKHKRINFKLDTGAAVNTIPSNIVAEMSPKVALMPTNVTLEAFGGSIIKPKGVVNLICGIKGRKANLKFVIVNLQTTPLARATRM
ncbi:hypothetical protein PR048_003505 [Dryococelus australis]|uniref:Peptidase A2 domain-containing protein n=1 Tax=Dryococelus australis TaxID=614101 RepID=A0ABQ9IN69_9NEOP|nr:hypothetical protein PR048_003505 [Dryococelus australis]